MVSLLADKGYSHPVIEHYIDMKNKDLKLKMSHHLTLDFTPPTEKYNEQGGGTKVCLMGTRGWDKIQVPDSQLYFYYTYVYYFLKVKFLSQHRESL